jgi:hypothetical protein
MTEDTWLRSTSLKAMLAIIKGKVSDRKLQLFACACGRRNSHKMQNYYDQHVLDVAERYADGLASKDALATAFDRGDECPTDDLDAAEFIAHDSFEYACFEADCAARDAQHGGTTQEQVRSLLCTLLRDIVGNPFRPCAIDRSWGIQNARTVMKTARFIYERRAFDRLPKLADALEKADCVNAEVLQHCRDQGPHVRGCWLVDLLLGRS